MELMPVKLFYNNSTANKTESKLMLCNTNTGDAKVIYTETDKAWVGNDQ
jgi:dipeptidyl-peptidase-4